MSSFNVGRFANPNRTERYVWPDGCGCPGTPHDEDYARFRVELGASAMARVARADLEGSISGDPLAAHRQLVLEAVTEWNLLREEPDPEDASRTIVVAVPVNRTAIDELRDSLVSLAEAIDEHTTGGPVPNASGAPSAASSRGSASRTRRTTRTRGT